MLKRKSTSNLMTGKDSKYDMNGNQSSSLNSSISAKMLMGSKMINKGKGKEVGVDKVNINDFLQKKKSMDYIRRENKDSLWKQMITNKDKNEKLIRF